MKTCRNSGEIAISNYFSFLFHSRLSKLRTPGLEITPVNGNPADNVLLGLSAKKSLVGSGSASKGSKLESALDRLGFQKRKVTQYKSLKSI